MKVLFLNLKSKLNFLLSSKYKEDENQYHNDLVDLDSDGHWQSDDFGLVKEEGLLKACLQKQA
jgi:hypothetical protein